MSGSAALEYGFPSTHSTNAVSVAIYSIFLLTYQEPDISPRTNLILQVAAYCYAFSIVLGRLYCGMHGFLDVLIGSLLGACIAIVQCVWGDAFDHWLLSGDLKDVSLVVLVICVFVRIHPEPADDCPCFDDSVAFSGVMIGISIGLWHFAGTSYSLSVPMPATTPFDLEKLGWSKVAARTVLGVLVIFIWRGTMKQLLLRVLPPIFRIVETLGLTLPRRFFKPASQYTSIPEQPHDDNVIPSAREIPQFLTSFRRRRAVSVGPQSEADAYEALAYREHQRKSSLTGPRSLSPVGEVPRGYFNTESSSEGVAGKRRRSSSLQEFRNQMGAGADALTGTAIMTPSSPAIAGPAGPGDARRMDDLQEKELFSRLEKPRVRYDVEVITKIIVYTGIAWWAVEGNPILFQLVGLGA